jgi:hypothetical protein
MMMDTTPTTDARKPRRINAGIGRVLVWIYGLFALSATARALVQIATQFHKAPLAYVLSAVSGVIYILATMFLARSTERSRKLAIACCSIELVGVIAVGAASLILESAFPDATVWSDFGQGYGYVPLILPIVGLWWLLRRSAREPAAAETAGDAAANPAPRSSPDDKGDHPNG